MKSNPRSDGPVCEDGTNLDAGTPYIAEFTTRVLPWYNPAESESSTNWKSKWSTLRGRFERIIDHYCSVECTLIQTRIPAYGRKSSGLPVDVRPSTAILSRNGLHMEPAHLFARDGSPLKGLFSIKSAKGDPILDHAGNNVALRFGMRRQFFVQPTLGWSGESGSLPLPVLAELARDGTRLLYQLPPEIAVSLWRLWPSGFSKTENSGESLWLDALVELSWQLEPASPLHSKRFAWQENWSVQLLGDGLFPRLPQDIARQPNASLAHEYGYPLAYYAKLEDVARASVVAIDEILERNTKRGNTRQNLEPTAVSSTPGTITNNQIMNGTKRDKLFISYCHKDAKFLKELLLHLKPLERAGLVAKWSDEQIVPGSEWFEEIKAALASTKVAVMMVSPGFLASDFIHEHELGPLLKEAEQGGVRILWIPVRASVYKETPLKNYQAVISPDKPVAEMKAERDKAWVKVCEEIRKALNPV